GCRRSGAPRRRPGGSGGEWKRISKMINRNLYKRLERLESRARAVSVPDGIRLVLVNDGTPGGLTCVWGLDGRLVWWNPPEGCKVGELLEDTDNPEARSLRGMVADEMRIVIIGARGGREAGPTTARGPDGRLVWLGPPEGSRGGEPIEDHLTRSPGRRASAGNHSSSRTRREGAGDPGLTA